MQCVFLFKQWAHEGIKNDMSELPGKWKESRANTNPVALWFAFSSCSLWQLTSSSPCTKYFLAQLHLLHHGTASSRPGRFIKIPECLTFWWRKAKTPTLCCIWGWWVSRNFPCPTVCREGSHGRRASTVREVLSVDSITTSCHAS